MTGKEAETGSGAAFSVPLQHLGYPESRKWLSEFEKREVRWHRCINASAGKRHNREPIA